MAHKSKLKKLRGKGYVEVSPSIERWRKLRKELGLHKPARKTQNCRKKPEQDTKPIGVPDPWLLFSSSDKDE